jgi:hypothetical protein
VVKIWSKRGDTVLTLDSDGDRIVLEGVRAWSDAWLV